MSCLDWVCEEAWYEILEAAGYGEEIHLSLVLESFMNLQSTHQLERGDFLRDPPDMNLQIVELIFWREKEENINLSHTWAPVATNSRLSLWPQVTAVTGLWNIIIIIIIIIINIIINSLQNFSIPGVYSRLITGEYVMRIFNKTLPPGILYVFFFSGWN